MLIKIGLATFCKDLLLNSFLKNGTSFIAIYLHTLEYSTSNTGGELLLLRNTLQHWLVALPDSTRKGGSCLLQLQNSSCIQEFISMKEHQTSIIMCCQLVVCKTPCTDLEYAQLQSELKTFENTLYSHE